MDQFFFMATTRLLPPTHRARIENEMIRRREKQFKHDQLWNGVTKYYQQWEKNNSKFEEWTSPRYHETNNKLIAELKEKREKEKNTEIRREKLKQLLMEEDHLYKVEMMVAKSKGLLLKEQEEKNQPVVSMQLLKELTNGIKSEEEGRRKYEAEKKLYQQWKINNPHLKEYERKLQCRDLKLSWLDQQIEKQMQNQKEEEECRRMLKVKEEKIKEEQEKERRRLIEIEEKQRELKNDLDKQLEELQLKSEASEELKKQEANEMRLKIMLDELEEQRLEEYKRRQKQKVALDNIKQYKIKLKKGALMVEEKLSKEKAIIEKLKVLDFVEQIENQKKKDELNLALEEFLIFSEDQKKLERMRQNKLNLVFDSEAQYEYEQQNRIWQMEEKARKDLLKDIMQTIQKQIGDNLQHNQEKQKKILEEREETLRRLEEDNREIEQLKDEEERIRKEHWRCIDEEVKLKKAKKKLEANQELKRINEELDRVRKEEERLKKEIVNMQKRQGPYRPPRSRIFLC